MEETPGRKRLLFFLCDIFGNFRNFLKFDGGVAERFIENMGRVSNAQFKKKPKKCFEISRFYRDQIEIFYSDHVLLDNKKKTRRGGETDIYKIKVSFCEHKFYITNIKK